MICPNCNAEVSESVKFCENCGAPIAAAPVQKEPIAPESGEGSPQPTDGFANTAQNVPVSPEADQQPVDVKAAAPIPAGQDASLNMQADPNAQQFAQPAADPNAGVQQYGQPAADQYASPQQYGQPAADPYANTQQYGQPAADPNAGTQQYGQPTTGQYAGAQQYGQPAGQYGSAPIPPNAYAAGTGAGAAAGAQVSGTPFVLAIVALVTSLLGLFPVGITLAIIALVMNSKQKKRGEFSTKQTPTTIMSIISLIVSAIVLVFTIMIGGFLAAYVASGGASSGSGGTITMPAPGSSSSKGKASSSASSTSASTSASAIAEKLAGTWDLSGIISKGKASSTEDIQRMQEMGLTISLSLKTDGSAALTLFGTDMTGTWESSDGETVRLLFPDETITATVVGNELSMASGTDAITLTKQ